jgi:hypothetical protein
LRGVDRRARISADFARLDDGIDLDSAVNKLRLTGGRGGMPRRNGDSMVIKIMPIDKGSPTNKLADAELHFTDGHLEGMRLLGFAVWQRRSGGGKNVTFPSRTYLVNGERRQYALFRPVSELRAQDKVRDLVLQAYADFEAQAAIAS